jgi:hypothetical protein
MAADDSDLSSEVACRANSLAGVFPNEDVAEIKSKKKRDRSLGFIGSLQALRLRKMLV